jgi:hypothetical protein
MAKKKKKSKLKKFLKGAALAGAAALGAKALMGKKGTGLTTVNFYFHQQLEEQDIKILLLEQMSNDIKRSVLR